MLIISNNVVKVWYNVLKIMYSHGDKPFNKESELTQPTLHCEINKNQNLNLL